MAIAESLEKAKKSLHDLIKKYKFKKAYLDRQHRAELTVRIAECNGHLNVCKKSFNSAIEQQVKHIAYGLENGMDTIPQEQIMWDAAIGYMLVEDAMYALKSVGSYDSLEHAYRMLDVASQQIGGNKTRLSKHRISDDTDRNPFGFINSDELVKAKEVQLDTFFNELRVTGNIDSYLHGDAAHRRQQQRNAEAASVSVKGSSAFDDFLKQPAPEEETIDAESLAQNAILNIKAPDLKQGDEGND